ncbi:hypothetical protein AVEN_46016-1, partial [Araneus ventricosus]
MIPKELPLLEHVKLKTKGTDDKQLMLKEQPFIEASETDDEMYRRQAANAQRMTISRASETVGE